MRLTAFQRSELGISSHVYGGDCLRLGFQGRIKILRSTYDFIFAYRIEGFPHRAALVFVLLFCSTTMPEELLLCVTLHTFWNSRRAMPSHHPTQVTICLDIVHPTLLSISPISTFWLQPYLYRFRTGVYDLDRLQLVSYLFYYSSPLLLLHLQCF